MWTPLSAITAAILILSFANVSTACRRKCEMSSSICAPVPMPVIISQLISTIRT